MQKFVVNASLLVCVVGRRWIFAKVEGFWTLPLFIVGCSTTCRALCELASEIMELGLGFCNINVMDRCCFAVGRRWVGLFFVTKYAGVPPVWRTWLSGYNKVRKLWIGQWLVNKINLIWCWVNYLRVGNFDDTHRKGIKPWSCPGSQSRIQRDHIMNLVAVITLTST